MTIKKCISYVLLTFRSGTFLYMSSEEYLNIIIPTVLINKM